ncbi:hypothetical protein NDN01_03445 [Sphingomonas sp. QA11]|uniref:hypothetical protein n=1 Tax=Sphingomonas sp. QA11 TaxID=2950605 RepID=UPI00234B8187|nr:hypothetical protein [Sphingomonas sp. QA11]WCM27996.1 hypothetical protein NDN01_03445 [Sphingomonas sp. QA11]
MDRIDTNFNAIIIRNSLDKKSGLHREASQCRARNQYEFADRIRLIRLLSTPVSNSNDGRWKDGIQGDRNRGDFPIASPESPRPDGVPAEAEALVKPAGGRLRFALTCPARGLVRRSDEEVKTLDPRKISDLTSLRVAQDQFEGYYYDESVAGGA